MATKVPRASDIAERFAKQLNVAYRAVRLYPPSSAIPRESATAALGTLKLMLSDDPEVRFVITKEGLFHEDGIVYPGQEAFQEFAHEFFSRRLAEVRFHSGTTATELIEFLRVLDLPRTEILSSGGIESRLWDSNVVNITVVEASTRIVEQGDLPDADGDEVTDEDTSVAAIDALLARVSSGRPRDQVVLVRLTESPERLAAYLKETIKGRGSTPPATWVTNRVRALAHAVADGDPSGAGTHLQALADAVGEFDDDDLREVLTERLLPEARHDDRLAEIVRRMGVDRVCSILADGLTDDEESREGLARAFRNLMNIGGVSRTEVMGAAAVGLEKAGAAPDVADAVLGAADPDEVTIRDTRPPAERSPLEKVLRLVDLAPAGVGGPETGRDIDRLKEEAREGITDGDILGSLVNLVGLEYRDEAFNSMMSIVEDSLGLLVLRQEYHVAADVAEALVEAAGADVRPEHQRLRVSGALDALAGKASLRAIAAAMRRFPPETLEHQACRRLLSVLGRHAIGPLLEVLADEPDMTARKAIVALVSEMAEEHLPELERHLSDERWYFVRNIVTIVGATRTPETLPMLERTLRYPDARVRRETIRAASAIKDALAGEMLVAALDDSDAQNVQVAARYLGLMAIRAAVPALERVAMGKGSGNRDVPARIEAIEALGRLGSAGSIQMLRGLTKARGLRGRARSREMATAAQAAIRAIERSLPRPGEGGP